MIVLNSKKTDITNGLNALITPYGNNYDLLIVGSVLSNSVIILFMLFQRYFIAGMTAGGIKADRRKLI